MLAIVAEALFILAKSDYLDIRRIDISGNKRIATAQILKLSRLTTKTNIFDWRSSDVRRRLLTEPWLESASVTRRFPLRVTIKVAERQPAAVIVMGTWFYLVDENLVVIKRQNTNIFTGQAVVLNAPPEDEREIGQRFTGASIRNALKALAVLDKELAPSVESVTAPSIDGLAFKLKSGPTIMYGKAEMTKQKNYAIKVILTEAANEGKSWQYIDVRVPSNPAAKAIG